MMGMTRSNVSRIMKYCLENIGYELQRREIIVREFTARSWIYNSKSKNDNDLVDATILNTIYGYFHSYSRQQVDEVLGMLNEDEFELLVLRYGMDLDNPVGDVKMVMADIDRLYGSVIPKIRNLLDELNYTSGYKKQLLIS